MLIKIFTSPTCNPCRTIHAEYDKIIESKDYEHDNLEIEYIDITTDEGNLYLQVFGIHAVPTSIFSHNHSDYTTLVGFIPEAMLRAEIDMHLLSLPKESPFKDIVELNEKIYYLDDPDINKCDNLIYYISENNNVYRLTVSSNTVINMKREVGRNRLKIGDTKYSDAYLVSKKGSEFTYE